MQESSDVCVDGCDSRGNGAAVDGVGTTRYARVSSVMYWRVVVVVAVAVVVVVVYSEQEKSSDACDDWEDDAGLIEKERSLILYVI